MAKPKSQDERAEAFWRRIEEVRLCRAAADRLGRPREREDDPRFLAQEIADQAWRLAQASPEEDQAPFIFTEQVCRNLPAEASPDRVQQQAEALLHQAFAFLYFERREGAWQEGERWTRFWSPILLPA